MAATGGVRAEARVAWCVWKKAAGRTKAAAGQRATRGVGREQEVVLVRLQRPRAAAKSSSGRWPGSVARRGEASAARGSGGTRLRRHVDRLRAARGRRCAAHGRQERRRCVGQRNRGGRGWRRKTRTGS
jgi:hypothetical protein